MRNGTLLVVGLVTLLVGSCVTPSIPIPPPSPEKMAFQVFPDQGTATFSYPPDVNYVGSVVFVYNQNLGRGIIEQAHDDGSVGPTQPLPAMLGNQIVVTFQHDDQSVSTCIKLRDGQQSSAAACQ